MNYKTELNGWATEMAIKAKAAGLEIEDLIKQTTQLVEFAFTPRKAYKDHVEEMLALAKEAPDHEANIDAIIAHLEDIKDQRIRAGLDKPVVAEETH